MRTLLIYLLGVLAFVAAKDLRDSEYFGTDTDCGLRVCDPITLFTKNDILEVPEEIAQLIGIGSPSEEEWLAIIKTFGTDSMPTFLAEKNYTIKANETGTFNNSDGVSGTWSARSYINYVANETNTNVSTISVDLFSVNGHNSSTRSIKNSYYIDSEGEVFWDTLGQSWTYAIDSNGTHTLVGNASLHTNGRFEMTSLNTSKFFVMGTEFSNMSNSFTITFSHTDGNETYGKEINFLAGDSNASSMPLNGSLTNGNNHMSIPYVNSIKGPLRQFEKTLISTDFSGNYTVGQEGSYNSASNSTITSPSSAMSKSSSSLQGHYSFIKKLLENIHQNPINRQFLAMNIPSLMFN